MNDEWNLSTKEQITELNAQDAERIWQDVADSAMESSSGVVLRSLMLMAELFYLPAFMCHLFTSFPW